MASFLGKLTDRDSRVLYFLGRDGVIVQCASTGPGSVVQAFKRLALAESNLKKGVPLDQLQTILSTYNSVLEVSSSVPDVEWVRRLQPAEGAGRNILEAALKRVEGQLKREEDAYLEWKGVRDLDEAHYNLKKRQEEVFDLNQKLVHVSQEPQFIYNGSGPLRRTVSAWQTTDRIRFQELKDQAKERASAVRLRIDFTRRQRIKDLKDQAKDLLDELETGRKRQKEHEKTVASLVETGCAVSASVLVRSQAVLVQGRKEAAILACEAEVLDSVQRLRRTLPERLGLVFRDGPVLPLLHNAAAKALVPSKVLDEQIEQIVRKTIDGMPAKGKLPEIRFPRFQEGKRFAYLGLALRDDLSRTSHPILYDLDEQGPRHTAVVGGSGSGKSVAASLIVEGAAMNGIPVIVFDPTGSWTGFAEPCASKSLLEAYRDFGLDEHQVRGFHLRVMVPKESGYEPDILTEALNGSGLSIFTSDSMTSTQEASFAAALLNDLLEKMRAWPESKTLRVMLVFEEAHRYLGEAALEPILEAFARTARARGVGLVIVSQVAVDLPPAIRNNCATKLQLFTNYSGDLSRAAQTFGSEYRKLIPKFSKGVGVIHYPEFGNALAAFRPPLHATAGLSPSSYAFFQSVQDLGRLARALTRHDATDDTTTSPEEKTGKNGDGEAPETNPTGDTTPAATAVAASWRDVAAAFKGSDVPASAISKAIREGGIRPPSLRTIQRFLRAVAMTAKIESPSPSRL